jgi:hypothetical protein
MATSAATAQPIRHCYCHRGYDPSSDLILGAEKLQQLLPYILHCIRTSTSRDFSELSEKQLVVRALSNTQAVLTTSEVQQTNPEMLESIHDICNKFLWARIIYKEDMVNHRPLEFHICKPGNEIQICVSHGNRFPFQQTIAKLARIYPDVVPNATPAESEPTQPESTKSGFCAIS